MKLETTAKTLVQNHRCHVQNVYQHSYCLKCGIYAPVGSTLKYLRPESFSSINVFEGDSTQILSYMILKQNSHRYYNPSVINKEQRVMLVRWVECLTEKLCLKQPTFYLAVAIIDAVLSQTKIPSPKLQMVAFLCINLATKMEEPLCQSLELAKIADVLNQGFTLDDLIITEQSIFKLLGFNLSIQTPYVFANYLTYRGALSSEEVRDRCPDRILSDFEELLGFFNRMSLECYKLYKYTALGVGAAIISCARKYTGLEVYWPAHLEQITKLSWSSIQECADLLESHSKSLFGDDLQIRNRPISVGVYFESEFGEDCGDQQFDLATRDQSDRASYEITPLKGFDSEEEEMLEEPDASFHITS